nr:hypothetical protein [Halocatena marina]
MTRTSDGYREGTYFQLSLLDEADLLLQSVVLDSRCSQIPIDAHIRQRIVNIISH